MGISSVLSIAEMAQVRQNVDMMLDKLKLDAYLFEVEPQEGQWEITVECATEEGWERVKFSAEEEYLLRGVDDAIVHELLMDSLGEALSSCRLRK